jgi:hypothetical protein
VRRGLALTACLLALAAPAAAEIDALDRLDRALSLSLVDGRVQSELSGLFDLEGAFVDERPPGLLFGNDGEVVNPRLSLFLDTHFGSRLYSLVQLRVDRGFDPRAADVGAVRFDEYFLRWTPFERPWLHLQAGKFATMIGNWVARHHSWDNPFVFAPLPYENVTIAGDDTAPADPQAFLGRRDDPDKKAQWLPIVWGPAYTTGLALFGKAAALEYAFEFKNTVVSSRPRAWDGRARGFEEPSYGGRIGWRPDPAFVLGASAERGPYMLEKANATIRPGNDFGDYEQTLVGVDAAYAWRRLQVWSEVFLSRFDVPNVDDADTVAYYVEARYRWRHDLFPALRWNQQLFGDVRDGAGGERAWDRDAWRIEAALTWRFDPHAQVKAQYAYFRQRGDLLQGEQLVAGQLTLKF